MSIFDVGFFLRVRDGMSQICRARVRLEPMVIVMMQAVCSNLSFQYLYLDDYQGLLASYSMSEVERVRFIEPKFTSRFFFYRALAEPTLIKNSQPLCSSPMLQYYQTFIRLHVSSLSREAWNGRVEP